MPERFSEQRPDGLDSGEMPAENIFGTKLKQLILDRGYKTQKNLSRRICVPNSNLNKWIKGHEFPGVEAMGKILVALEPEGEDLDAMMSGWGQFLASRRQRDNVAGIPYGGTPGDNRFSVSLKILMVQSGRPLQLTWAKELGVRQGRVSEWITGKNIPSKEQLEILLQSVSDADHLQSDLMEAWEEQVIKRGPRAHMVGKKTGIPKTEVGKWVIGYSEKHQVPLRRLSCVFALKGATVRVYDNLSVDSMSDIIHQAENVLKVDQKSLEDLCEAVALSVEGQVKRGRYRNNAPRFKRHRYGV